VSSEKNFAEALSGVLGPLYRVSVLNAQGQVEASFGELGSARATWADIPLPRSSQSLRVEVDLDAVEAAERVVSALVPKTTQVDVPAGAFTHVNRAIDELIQMAEAQIQLPISQMSRAEKQQVVRFLDERGAFNLKKSVETVADVLGVSRFTVYNYLDSTRQS
jgi:HTH domain